MPGKKTDCAIYFTGIFLIVGGLVIGFFWPLVFNCIWKEKLELNPTSDSYKLWIKTPIPMYLDVFLFNWTNSKQFMKDKTLKPEFEEVGPFVFKEIHERVNITWNNNYTVSYNQTRTWFFVPEESVNISVPITNLNVVATTIARIASTNNEIFKLIIDFLTLFYKEELIVTKPAREWLFDGMNDALLDFIRKWTYVPVSFNKFGWFYNRNSSSTFDGLFNVKTGEDDIYNLGMIEKWNNVNKTRFFEDECGIVKGSSGELFSPLINSQNNLSIFITDFCSPLTLKYKGLTHINGLNGYHYAGDKNVFGNGSEHCGAKCFCNGECSPSGVRNVTSCRQAPLFISFPHFYLADPIYINAVGGMNPNESEHEFYLKIDPLTGIPIEVRAQLQINVLLRPLKGFPMFERVPKVYIPMIWFRQRAKITPALASKGELLRIFGKMGWGLACGLTLIGLLMILVRICIVYNFFKTKKFETLITSDTESEEPLQTGVVLGS